MLCKELDQLGKPGVVRVTQGRAPVGLNPIRILRSQRALDFSPQVIVAMNIIKHGCSPILVLRLNDRTG